MSLPPTLVQILMCHKGNVYLSCSNSECLYVGMMKYLTRDHRVRDDVSQPDQPLKSPQ